MLFLFLPHARFSFPVGLLWALHYTAVSVHTSRISWLVVPEAPQVSVLSGTSIQEISLRAP